MATIFNAKSGEPIEAYYVFDPEMDENGGAKINRELTVARFSRDGRRIALGVSDGSIRVRAPANKSYKDLMSGALRKRMLTERERTEFDLK
jgi:hypothetical protein